VHGGFGEVDSKGTRPRTLARQAAEQAAQLRRLTKRERVVLTLLGLLAVGLMIAASLYIPPGIDWRDTYRPAAQALQSGRSPFSDDLYFPAPWALIPLLPLALLPVEVGRAVLPITSIVAFAFVAHRMGARPISLVAFLLSPPVLHCLLNGNIECLALLGLALPPQIGLFLVLIKPQIGLAVAVFWAVEAWRDGGVARLVRVYWPITLVTLISVALFGPWPLRFLETPGLVSSYNASLWPASIPVGMALLVASIRTRKIRFALAASPCLSPVVLLHAWSGALVAVVVSTSELVAAVVGMWVLVIIQALVGRS
jgi:hypothetical protein